VFKHSSRHNDVSSVPVNDVQMQHQDIKTEILNRDSDGHGQNNNLKTKAMGKCLKKSITVCQWQEHRNFFHTKTWLTNI